MGTYRIDLAYDGSGFKGYARNPGVRTVQGEVEQALATVLQAEVTTKVAGRTDSGVHARTQVISFATSEVSDLGQLERSLRRMLAPEIAVAGVHRVEDGFDARFDARSRTYRYFVDEAEIPDPLRRHVVWHVGAPLDLKAMDQASNHFVGEHDFASLCRAKPDKTTVRTVYSADWARESGLAVFEVTARAFCHQMVRSMVALCVEVGRNRVAAEAVPGVLEAGDRNAARGTAPARGLVLWDVEY